MDGATLGVRGRLASHCLLIEAPRCLVLVDTGYGLRDVATPRARLNPLFLSLLKPDLRAEMTAVRQIEALGFDPRDVRHILLSHLDFDHAGGLDDFPDARVHVMASEVASAIARKTVLDRMRYRPEQWSTRPSWQTYRPTPGESWRGFARVSELPGLPPEILMIPLPGHTLGHAGFAIEQGPRWLFYAGDAYFYHGEMAARPSCPPGLRLYQRLMEKDRELRLENQARLRALASARDLTVMCSHDPHELAWIREREEIQPPAVVSRGAGAAAVT